jgi:hypothetical protein
MPKYRDLVPTEEEEYDENDDDNNHNPRIHILNGTSPSSLTQRNPYKTPSLRGDGYGSGTVHHRMLGGIGSNASAAAAAARHIQSHNYEPDESEVWRAYVAGVHFRNRGQWWTTGKKRALKRWVLTLLIGVLQAVIATLCNFASRYLSKRKYDAVYELLVPRIPERAMESSSTTLLNDDLIVADTSGTSYGTFETSNTGNSGGGGGSIGAAFLVFVTYQVIFAAIASIFVYIEPVCVLLWQVIVLILVSMIVQNHVLLMCPCYINMPNFPGVRWFRNS